MDSKTILEKLSDKSANSQTLDPAVPAWSQLDEHGENVLSAGGYPDLGT